MPLNWFSLTQCWLFSFRLQDGARLPMLFLTYRKGLEKNGTTLPC